MDLTNEAIDFINDALEKEATKTVRVYTEQGRCGQTLELLITAPDVTDEVRDYAGFQLAIAQDARDMSEGIMLDVESTEEGMSLILRGLKNFC